MTEEQKYLAVMASRLGQLRRMIEGLIGLFMGLWTVAAVGFLWVSLDTSDPARVFHAAILFALYPFWAWVRAMVMTLSRLGQRRE